MMNKTYYGIVFAAICIAQILINNFFDVSQYLLLSLMPLLMMSFPLKYSNISAMITAFLVGLVIDFTSSSVLGITSCALLLCAFLKNGLLKLVFGEEIFSFRDGSPLSFHTTKELVIASLLFCALYFLPYVIIDCAGTRPLLFLLLRWVYSSALSALVIAVLASFIFKAD